ncbi:MAG: TlpA disulfide reductase family protein [Terriglobia bacterium]
MIQLQERPRSAQPAFHLAGLGLFAAAVFLLGAQPLCPQGPKVVWSDQEKPIVAQLHTLRGLPDDVRTRTTKQLALDIRQLPASDHKVRLANSLANLSTEGDFGHDTLQEVATTLAEALRESPPGDHEQSPLAATAYVELAQLVRYEHVQAAVDSPQFAAAMSKLAADDQRRQQADFTLTDLEGTRWTLKDLRGKVVLVNFWATCCPPCRKEMPDLQTLYTRFKDQGLVILAISDEDAGKVKPFVAERNVTYPILLDPGRKVNALFQVEGIPKSFVYDRNGRLAAQAIDMRTQKQFLEMLAPAGIP